mgnify:FL=1
MPRKKDPPARRKRRRKPRSAPVDSDSDSDSDSTATAAVATPALLTAEAARPPLCAASSRQCSRLPRRVRLSLVAILLLHVGYLYWFARGFAKLQPRGGLLRLRGTAAAKASARDFEFEDSMEEDKQIRASEQSANMASLYTAFCEAVNKNDASGIERSRNTIIEELSHKSGETLMELQARSPDYLCELSRWSSIEPFKRFLITLGRGDDVADSSYDDVKNTALVELSPKVSISVDKLQDMSIYERGAYFLPSFLTY